MATISSVVAEYERPGETIPFTPSADVAAGNVVQDGDLVGVAKVDIDSGELGSLAITGVFNMPAETQTSASATYSKGGTVYWDSDNDQVTSDSGDGVECGIALEDPADTGTCLVLLNG